MRFEQFVNIYVSLHSPSLFSRMFANMEKFTIFLPLPPLPDLAKLLRNDYNRITKNT